jgi:hypothetical protein
MTPGELAGLVQEGLSMAKDVPPEGATFASSVSRKLVSIAETVKRTDRVTPKQAKAVTNMIVGLQKWVGPPTTH